MGFDAITGLARGGDEAAAAISRLGDAIYDAAMKALLLGEGPLAGLLGGGEGGCPKHSGRISAEPPHFPASG